MNEQPNQNGSKNTTMYIFIGVGIGLFILFIIVGFFAWRRYKKYKSTDTYKELYDNNLRLQIAKSKHATQFIGGPRPIKNINIKK